MDEQRRRHLLRNSPLGQSILKEEEQQGAAPIPPERRKLLGATWAGQRVLREHDAQQGRDPQTGRFVPR